MMVNSIADQWEQADESQTPNGQLTMIDTGKYTVPVSNEVPKYLYIATVAEAEKCRIASVVQYLRHSCDSPHHIYDDHFPVFLARSGHVICAPYILTRCLDENMSFGLSRA